MIIHKIKSNFTPLLMDVINGHFQICNSILLGCLNCPFMIMAKVIRSRLGRLLLLIILYYIDTDKWIVIDKYQDVNKSKKKIFGWYV